MRPLGRAEEIAWTLGAALLLFAGSARAATLVEGGSIDDATWTASGSPYLLNDDLVVPPGKVLILEAGTSVVVGSSDLSATGEDPERIELRIQGELYVNGTLSAPVSIWNENASVRDAWYGIVVEPEATHARLQYATIANGYDCLESSAPAANLEVVATTFDTCDAGAVLEGGAARFDRVLVHDSSYGIWLQDAPGAILTNVISRGNDTGIYVLSSTLALENVTLSQNTTGLAAASLKGVPTAIALSNSIFANNTPQFKLGSNVTVSVSYSDVWPAAPDNAHVTLGAGTLSVDPGFVGAPDDLHLAATSACIDIGSAETSSDHDFDRNERPLDGNRDGTPAPDLGAYELFFRAFCGDGELDVGEVCDEGDANGTPNHCNEDCAGPGGIAGAGGTAGAGGIAGTGGMAGEGSAGGVAGGGVGNVPNGGAAEPSNEPAGMAGIDTSMAPESKGGATTTASTGGSPAAGDGAGGSRPSSTGAGDAGRGGTGATSESAAGEGGESSSSPRCVPGTRDVCRCPDGSDGTLVCDSERIQICYCSASPAGGESTPPPAAAEGCGCRIAPARSAFGDWLGLFGLGALARFGRRSRRSRRRHDSSERRR